MNDCVKLIISSLSEPHIINDSKSQTKVHFVLPMHPLSGKEGIGITATFNYSSTNVASISFITDGIVQVNYTNQNAIAYLMSGHQDNLIIENDTLKLKYRAVIKNGLNARAVFNEETHFIKTFCCGVIKNYMP